MITIYQMETLATVLSSNIEKDITHYNIRYALPRNFRFMNSSWGTNLISIIT